MNEPELIVLSKEEESSLQEEAYILLDNLIKTNPLCIMQPKFEEVSNDYILNVLNEQLNDLVIDKNLCNIIAKAKSKYYKLVMPPRSYKDTFIRNHYDKEKMRVKLEYIKNIPQPAQRTTEWYEFRYKHLTASSAWKAFSTQSAQNQLIYGKCCPLDTAKYTTCNINTPMHHGNKYEPLSLMYYEQTYNTHVSDFGCIPHFTHKFLAASPDGINTDITSGLYGRMLEVKNIVNREINGIPKIEYWIQMQLQMEACDLNECDFLETQFVEYKSKEEFDGDGTFTHTEDNKLKGIIMYFSENDNPLYEYCPLSVNSDEFEIWEKEMHKKHEDKLWMKNLYWRLDIISCVLVLRNKLWFKHGLPILESLWNTILSEKDGDYSHRAPKKKAKSGPFAEFKSSKCYINLLTPKTKSGPFSGFKSSKCYISLPTTNAIPKSSIKKQVTNINVNT
jgi:putative phage-type endonuclease